MSMTLQSQILEAAPEVQDAIMKQLMLAHLARQNGNQVSAVAMDDEGLMGYVFWNPKSARPLPPLSEERMAELQRRIDTIDDAIDADVFLEQWRLKELEQDREQLLTANDQKSSSPFV